MKRLMIVAIAMVMLLSISEKAQADPWTNWAFRRSSCGRSAFGLGASHRFGFRPVLGRSPWTNWAFGRSSYGRYGGYGGYGYGRDRTLTRVAGYGGLAMNVLDMLDQRSTTKQLVNHQISMDNQMVNIIREEQNFRHGQHRIIGVRSNTVLRTRVPIRRIKIKPKPKKTQTIQTQQTQENEKLRQERQKVEMLELKLKAIKLEQELQRLEKQAKK